MSRTYDMSRRDRQAEKTAGRIRDAAWAHFSTRAYDEVTLAAVALGAGVSVPTVRTHFGRKEDLFLAGYVDWGMRAIENRERARKGEPLAAVRSLLADYEQAGRVGLHLLAEEDRFPAVRQMTQTGREYHRWWLEEVFDRHLSGLTPRLRKRRVAQLFLVTELTSWKLLRLDLGLSRRLTEAAVLESVQALTGA